MGQSAAVDLVHRRRAAETLKVGLRNHVKAGQPMASKGSLGFDSTVQ